MNGTIAMTNAVRDGTANQNTRDLVAGWCVDGIPGYVDKTFPSTAICKAAGTPVEGHESGNTDTSCGYPALAKGSTDRDNISLLQTLINQTGTDTPVAVDGIFGAGMDAAVVALNKAWGTGVGQGHVADCGLWNALLAYKGDGGNGNGDGKDKMGKVTCPAGTTLAADGVSCVPNGGTGDTKPPAGGMSTTTMALIGGAALLGVLLLTKK
jgi:hypothetical protein